MPIDINKHEVDIDNLFKQNELDLCSIKELYRKLKEMEKKISQIKYIDNNLADKLKKDYEKLKRIILDENIQVSLSNDIKEIDTSINNINNDINEINTQLDTIDKYKIDIDSLFKFGRSKTKNLWFGNITQINFIGDSITHGANCPDIPNQAWAELLKASLRTRLGTESRGIEKLYTMGTYKMLHEVSTVGFKLNAIDNDVVTLSSYSSTTLNDKLTITPNISSLVSVVYAGSNNNKFKWYLKSKPNAKINGGSGDVLNAPYQTVTLFCEKGDSIIIENTSGLPIKILGINYSDNKNIQLNNFGRSGATLKDINSNVISHHTNCEVAFFALGHNDSASYGSEPTTEFINNLNSYITNFKNNKTFVVVLDFIWHYNEDNKFRQQLKRLAKEVDGIYIPFREYLFPGKIDTSSDVWLSSGFLSDWSHPTPQGHRIIADVVCGMLNLPTINQAKENIVNVSSDNSNIVINHSLVEKNGVVKGNVQLYFKGGDVTFSNSNVRINVPPKYQTTVYGLEVYSTTPVVSGCDIKTDGSITFYLQGDANKTTKLFTFDVNYITN